jgi:hypothetical protein
VAGVECGIEVLSTLRPKVIVPLNNNDATYTGVLSYILTDKGGCDPATVRAWLDANGIKDIRVAGDGPQQYSQAVDIFL